MLTHQNEFARYRAIAQQRWQAEQTALIQRREQALVIARQAATLLRVRLAATAVLLFGSLAHGQWFSASSDIDLAAWGIQQEIQKLERICEMSAEMVDQPKPGAANLRQTTRNAFDEYRGFRHVVQNVYTFTLDPERIALLVKNLITLASTVASKILAFTDSLEQIANGI